MQRWVHSPKGDNESISINKTEQGVHGGEVILGSNYHNPNPLACLVGPTNQTEIELEGVRLNALKNTGAHMSCVNKWLVEKLQLPIELLKTGLNTEDTGGG